jgi:flagellar biosynthesis anti-sigma factor FlgM
MMKTDAGKPAIELNAYLKQLRQKQLKKALQQERPSCGQGIETGKVNMSEQVREVRQAARALQLMPDVREAKVARVRMAVEQGTYRVDGAKVATGMLRESFENNLILQNMDIRAD